MSFAVDEIAVKHDPRESWRGHSGDMSWPPEGMLEDGDFNARNFWAIGDFVVSASILPFDVEDLPEFGSLESFKVFRYKVHVLQA